VRVVVALRFTQTGFDLLTEANLTFKSQATRCWRLNQLLRRQRHDAADNDDWSVQHATVC